VLLSIPNLLGIMGTIGLMLFYIPQLWTAWRTPKLEGFNLFSWCILLVAVIALMTQSILLNIWTAAIANMVGTIATSGMIVKIIIGGRNG